jgi:peptide/nickel transport system substrate-binding protein/oligopeptide transport system substrate-binding protein
MSGAAFLLLTVLILLSGCAPAWPFPQPTPDLKLPDAQQILRPLEIGPNAGDLATLDPALITFGVDYDKAQLIFPRLVTLNEQNEPVDWAAESHEVSADGLTWTFHLRSGMTWSDGSPIDANTFAYSINRALDPCTGSDVANYLYNIKGAANFNGASVYDGSTCPAGAKASSDTLIGKSIVVADPLTLKLTLEAPAGYFLAMLSYPTSWAIPRQLIDQYGDQWTEHLADHDGFGGNLFTLTRWDHQGHLDFARNERFWGQMPLLRRIEYTLYRDPGAAWSAYKEGGGDLVQPVLRENTQAKTLARSTYIAVPLLSMKYLRPNWRKAPFDDMRVRQAFWLAIDRQALMQTVNSQLTQLPLAQPTMHLLIEGAPEYNADLRDPAGRTGAQALSADLATARALVTAYAAEKCGGRLAQCPPVDYSFNGSSPEVIRRADALVAQWQAAFPGWQISYGWCDRCTQIDSSWSHPLSNGSWVADYPDGQDFLSLLWRTGAPNNRTVSLSAADTLLDQADVSNDRALRTRLYQQAEQLLVIQVAAIPLFQYQDTYVVRSRVVGWRIAPTGQTPLSVWQTAYLTR